MSPLLYLDNEASLRERNPSLLNNITQESQLSNNTINNKVDQDLSYIKSMSHAL